MAFDPVSALFDVGGKLIDRLWPDPQQRDAAKMRLVELQQNGELAELAAETDLAKGQLKINEEEAKHSKLFVAGWRPFIGWVCGVAFAYHFILQPVIVFAMVTQGRELHLPEFNIDQLFTVLMGMLGLGGLRTVEKIKGVARDK